MRALWTAITAIALLAPSLAWADPPQVAPVISPVDRGQVAPFTGVLLSPAAVARLVAQQDTAQAEAQLAVQHQQAVDQAQQRFALESAQTQCSADATVLRAQLADAQRTSTILQGELKRATGGPSPPLWIAIGFGAGVAVTLVTTVVVAVATK